MCLPQALNYKSDFRGLGNKFPLDVFVPGGAYLPLRSAGITARAPRPAALRVSPPQPVCLDWVLVSDKRRHPPICTKQGSDNPADMMKLLVELWEGLYEGSLR